MSDWGRQGAQPHASLLLSDADVLRRVLVRVSADVTAPFADRKFDGVFNISTEFSPMASPAFEVGRYV